MVVIRSYRHFLGNNKKGRSDVGKEAFVGTDF